MELLVLRPNMYMLSLLLPKKEKMQQEERPMNKKVKERSEMWKNSLSTRIAH